MSKIVLLIEDNAKHSILFEDLLLNEGYEVAIARDGDEVTQKMSEIEKSGWPSYLICVDIAVPRFDAISFIKEHRDRVLVVSASADREDVKKLLPENRRIKKPFDIQLFKRRIREILG